jgi:hypothetical protein
MDGMMKTKKIENSFNVGCSRHQFAVGEAHLLLDSKYATGTG